MTKEDFKYKIGDKVMIVEDDSYINDVKKHYGKVLKIKKRYSPTHGIKLYKVGNIKGWATESCIKPCGKQY